MRRLLYGRWRILLDGEFQENEERGRRVFRLADKTAYVWLESTGLSQKEGIQRVKAQANSRYVTLFEDECWGPYRWAFKHAEEIETPLPNRFALEAYYVTEGETLTVCTVHQQPEDRLWAETLVRSVGFDRDWKVEGSACALVYGPMLVLSSHSRTEDGEWFINCFIASVRTEVGVGELGKVVRQAMSHTQRGVLIGDRTHVARPPRDEGRLAHLLGDLSQSTMDNFLDVVNVSAQEGVIKLLPSWALRGFDYQCGYLPMYGQEVQLPRACSDEELGAGLLEARGRCSGWGDEPDASN
jgi:hypothetical protein